LIFGVFEGDGTIEGVEVDKGVGVARAGTELLQR
jgi:hypothetical protein